MVHTPCAALPALVLLSACLAPIGHAVAQESGSLTGTTALVPVEHHPVVPMDVPLPPKALLTLPHHGASAPLPRGTGTSPQPSNPPTEDRVAPTAGAGPAAAGDFTWFRNQSVDLTGAPHTFRGEPSVAQVRDTVLMTGNWWAGISRDSGMTFTRMNPATFFPAIDNGFVADQRSLYIPSHDLTVWFLLYAYSPTTLQGSYRLAVSQGRDNLRNGVWYSYVFNGNNLGLGTRRYLDFPDICFGRDGLWMSAHVFSDAPGYVTEVIWRVPLDQLAAAGAVTVTAWQFNLINSPNAYRFAQGATNGTMFFAAHRNTTTLRVYSCAEPGAVVSWVDRTVASWTNTGEAGSAGPDGRPWSGIAVDNWVHTAYATATELGFLWGAAQDAAINRPFPYVRVARFRTSDRTLIAEHDIYNPSFGVAYPAVATNARGDVGGVLAVGGGPHYPHSSAFLIDSYDPWPPFATYASASGTHGPDANGWGDYYTVQRHPVDDNTFVAGGVNLNGGPSNAFSEHRYLWFGREEVTPSWVDLSVSSAPITNVPVGLAETDRLGQQDGMTSFTRSFGPQQGYTLTAPLTAQNAYVFERWMLRTAPIGFFLPQPVDQRVLTVDNIGASADAAVANFVPMRVLTVNSVNPALGVTLVVNTVDIFGLGNGTTPTTRRYKDGTQVLLTVPAVHNGNPFKRWVVGGVGQTAGVTAVTVDLNQSLTAVAEYWHHTTGTFTPFGAGCAGSAGVLNQVPGTVLPEIGNTPTYVIAAAPTNSVALLVLGFSNTQWSGIPLPFVIGPAAPGCSLLTELVIAFGLITNGRGSGSVPFPLANDPTLIGGHYYTQYWSLDAAANALGMAFSPGIDTMVGGNW